MVSLQGKVRHGLSRENQYELYLDAFFVTDRLSAANLNLESTQAREI
jgi:hypothetical protein